MTGEMHQSEVTEENFPLHFAIAKDMGGTVHAFDQYQGPYILVPRGKLWLSSEDGVFGYVYNERNGRKSTEFILGTDDADDRATDAAYQVI